MSAKEQIDCWRTDEVVCPYCGFEHTDSWEWFSGAANYNSKKIECEDCNRKFEAEADQRTYYSTSKIEDTK